MHWFMALSKAQRTGVVYGLVLAGWLFGLELPAKFGWLPILTLSGDVQHAVKWWHVVGILIALFFLVLWGAVNRPRVHVAAGVVNAEPGVDEDALARLEAAGLAVRRWPAQHHYFGGVSASGRRGAAADPRRSGAVAVSPARA